ncbi:hypothetical protein SAT01_14950 [Sinomonas atrocyanea]|nr:hypothetical protein SAT01_14950 [Sinomonas atrocyanea]GGG70648.1 hypothetical protein GCM10007172_23620 [Sinomonas atrocyanea]
MRPLSLSRRRASLASWLAIGLPSSRFWRKDWASPFGAAKSSAGTEGGCGPVSVGPLAVARADPSVKKGGMRWADVSPLVTVNSLSIRVDCLSLD